MSITSVELNNKRNTFVLKTNMNVNEIQNTFLSSCFKYYYGKVKIINNQKNQSKLLRLSDSFKNTANKGSIIIIDYPNIIHILHNHYHNFEKVCKHFYHFIYQQLQESSKIFIIAKSVIIDDNNYDILKVFETGEKVNANKIHAKYFEKECICIYNFNYIVKTSSSLDDLISYFICFVLFGYLLNNNKDPNNKTIQSSLPKLNIMTNDKQMFDKNLFGQTKDEKKNKMDILKHLKYSKLVLKNNKYIYEHNFIEEQLIKQFLISNMNLSVDDTKNLECNLSVLIEMLLKKKNIYGFFKKENGEKKSEMIEYNPNFLKNNFTEKLKPSFSYKNLNKIKNQLFNHRKTQKIHKKNNHCNFNAMLNKKKDLLENYYLYVFIKYIQMYLFSIKENNETYGNFFGGFEREKIIQLMR